MAKAAKRGTRRPSIDAAQAAALLGCDPRTVRAMVEGGRLEGQKVRVGKRFSWRIFEDQPQIERAMLLAGPHPEASRAGTPTGELALEVAELRSQSQCAEVRPPGVAIRA